MSSLRSKTDKPEYWRSLAELQDSPEFKDFVQREFREPLEAEPVNSPARRRFMQLMGASFALAGCRWQEDRILPYSRRPEGAIPGEAVHYATTMEVGGVATGLWAKSFDGRPIKIEGNPDDLTSLGGTNTYHQASVLGLYDPDRSQGYVRFAGGRKASDEAAFFEFALPIVAGHAQRRGAGLAVLAESNSSPSLKALRQRLLQQHPDATWVQYDPTVTHHAVRGCKLAFGEPYRPIYVPERADVIVGLDSDLISGAAPGGLGYARRVAARRDPDSGTMSRIYAIESAFTELGSLADHRLCVRSAQIKAVCAYLDQEISGRARPLPEHGPAQTSPDAGFLEDEHIKKVLDVIVSELVANTGKSLVVAGACQPPEVHALVHRLNVLLGNVGRTVRYVEDEDFDENDGMEALATLVEAMSAGKVETLVVLGGNPVFTSPVDIPFAEALGKVKNSIHLSLYEDETSRASSWHVPQAHFLETWGDARAFDGSIRLAQPLIEPLFDGLSALELLARLFGEAKKTSAEIVKATLSELAPTEKAWRRAVHDGRIEATAFDAATPKLKPLQKLSFESSELGGVGSGEKLELDFEFDQKVHDGRFANNGWLMELPHAISKLTWDNAALVAPKTADELGIEDGHLAAVELGGKTIELPLLKTPGMAEGTVRIALGYGRTHAGKVGGSSDDDIDPVGANAYLLRSTNAYYMAHGVTLREAGGRQRLGITQDLHVIDRVGKEGTEKRLPQLVREGTLERYKKHPNFAKHMVHHPPLLDLWVAPVSYEGQKWGMAIDMNKCTGCSGCVIACQAENNIPVVGKEPVAMGREMHWIRIDRYYKGDEHHPEIKHQPMTCQQCEKAPCEQVCPVGATMHSREGLNDMVYNRCIGTRYCSNNCPYKVRRFNYFNYNVYTYGKTPYTGTDDPGAKLKSMVYNPDVTVRGRGVMEKCTYCVQRVQKVKIAARNQRRAVRDGEIKTACEQACPTGAIVFGDLNDNKSRVRALHNKPRAYEMLEELNNRTRNNYLARINNPHPELVEQDGHSERH